MQEFGAAMGLIKNKAALLSALLILAAVSIVVFYPVRQQPSESDFTEAITTEIPAYLHDDKPIFKITSVTRHDIKWYVVTIQSINEVDTIVPVRIAFKQIYNDLVMVVRPTTYLTKADQQQYSTIPESVILELRK
jgi:hypothetical protein